MSTTSQSDARPDRPSTSSYARDEKRLRALREYDVLDTDPEPAFDRIARLAAHLFDAPTALVNLIDEDRQWFKSTVGFDEDQTDLDVSFCVYTVEKDDVLVVEDLSEDERFADNPYVTDHDVRFYAGAPLLTPHEQRIGTLCVLDTEPRFPSEDTVDRLADLAAMVVDELELRRERIEHEQSRELLRQSQQLADVGGAAYDPETNDVTWTDQTYDLFGLSSETEVDLDTAVDFYTPESRSVIEPEVERLLDEGGQYDLELDVVTADGERRHVRTIAEAQRENDETTQIVGAIQDVTGQHRDRRLQEMQGAFFEWIATGASIDAVLDEIARFTEEELPDAVVSILRLDDNRLHHVAGPSLPKDYIDAIDGVEIGPDVGTFGTAAHHEHEVVTEDIREDDRWEGYRSAAERAGFRSCTAQVIRESEGAVLGTFAIYRAEPGGLDAEERQLVKRMSHVASVALEREQRERALRESEERWRRLVDHHPGPIHVSIDGKYAYANQATAQLLGVDSPDDLIGRNMSDFVHPDERDLLRDRTERLYEDRKAADLIETRIQRPDGSVRTIVVRSVPIQYDGRDAAQTMMWDVTERREAERELRHSEQKFRTVVENAQPMTFMVDRDGTILLSEGKDLQSFGLEPGETVGKSTYDRYANNPGVINAVERALDGEYVDEEVQVDGLIFDTWYSPFYDDDGAVAGAIGMAADITERREAQMELRKQKEMLQTVVDNVPVMITLVENGEIEMINNHVEEVLGGSAEALEGAEGLLERCYPDPERRQRVLDAIEEAPDEWRDYRPMGRDGVRVDTTWKHIELADGRNLGIGVDISDRKARERALWDSNERLRLALEAANAGSFEYDLATDRVVWDERSLELYGLDLDPVEQDAAWLEDVILEEDLPRVETVFDRAVEEGKRRYDVSYRIRRANDGEVRHIRSYGVVVRDEDGTAQRVIGINRDVTDRKERENQLRLLEAAVEHSCLTVLITEADPLDEPGPETVYVNPFFTEMTGYDRDEILGRSPRMLQGSDTDRAALNRIRTALENEEPVREVVRNYTKDGTPYWNDFFIAPVQDDEGKVTHFVSIQDDVTERRRRKRELERQNDLFAKAQDIASVGAWEYDVQSGELTWTEETYRIHRLESDVDVTPERALEFYHPDDRTTIREAFERAVEAGESYDFELRLITADDEQRWVRTRGEPQEEDGEIVRVRGTLQDITEQKTSRLRLERQREYTDHLFNAVDDLFFALDEDGRFQRWNERIPDVTGYSDEEIGERTAFDLVPESEHERVAATIREAIATGSAQIEVPLLRRDGTTIPYEYAGSLVEHPEGGLQIVGIGRDISERVRRRNELEEAKEAAEEADRIKSALLSNMNHELRTPLTSIISFSEIIGSKPALAETFADRIHGGGKRLLHTLNTVMDFAELEADAFSPTPKPVDLSTLARSVVNEFSHQIERKALSVEVNEPDGTVTAVLDEYLGERILAHLVSNAVKFTDEGGAVAVTVSAAGQAVALRVADTGVGIDPDFLPHVYDQFAQASSGYNRTHEGNGLGLTIVKRMVDRLSGDLSIDSTPGEGTTVTVRLPGVDRPDAEGRASDDAGS
jgi:PAS domain S-box-containing protein